MVFAYNRWQCANLEKHCRPNTQQRPYLLNQTSRYVFWEAHFCGRIQKGAVDWKFQLLTCTFAKFSKPCSAYLKNGEDFAKLMAERIIGMQST